MVDPVTKKIWQVREEMVKRAGGFDAYFDGLMEFDRKRLAAEAAKKKAKRAAAAKKRTIATASKKSKTR